ncbi:hypothetical protein C8P68_101729 [Mucilaginibacter yixingensis]|uniref:Methyltransferase family protein n=1 Tax=Mucilaginibacter yixingensis TaxID=1295612 RepID=A0A2T5JGF6_9SPHI|nr:hypothetical protein [Mucilaginibacter yixingensis]PTR01495.1 hypothetical protein C8P68_101729 [Mucilaginibacter yixingensis]
MIELIRQLILAEVKLDRQIVNHICNQANAKPHYDSVYRLTYNQADPKVEDLILLMQDHDLASGKKIMEIMAGNGFESQVLKNAFPGNEYTCLDHSAYFSPISGLAYCTADCTDASYKHPDQQDLVFIGGANASMCMLLTLKELLRLAVFLQHNVRLGGIAVLSYFEENCNATNFIIDYSVKEIKNDYEGYNGLYAHWFSAVKCDVETQLHHYYDLVAVSGDDELTTGSTYKEISYHDRPFITRSWQSAIVTEVMNAAGFKYVGNKWNPDTRFMPFQKVKCLESISFL